MRMYRPLHRPRKTFLRVNGIRHCIREWGGPADRPILMLHGHLDSSATFQFLADELAGNYRIVAPDLRGFGETRWAAYGYSFEDYLADIDAIVEHHFCEPVTVVGHSLGGNLAMMFAGVRNKDVNAVVSLDGFGMSDFDRQLVTTHYRRWLDAKRRTPCGLSLQNLEDATRRLMRANANLPEDKAHFLASKLSKRIEGKFAWRFDPAHRGPFPRPYCSSDWLQAIQEITVPVLWIGSDQPYPPSIALNSPTLDDRIRLSRASFHRVAGASHNLHHDAPKQVAAHLVKFLKTFS